MRLQLIARKLFQAKSFVIACVTVSRSEDLKFISGESVTVALLSLVALSNCYSGTDNVTSDLN